VVSVPVFAAAAAVWLQPAALLRTRPLSVGTQASGDDQCDYSALQARSFVQSAKLTYPIYEYTSLQCPYDRHSKPNMTPSSRWHMQHRVRPLNID